MPGKYLPQFDNDSPYEGIPERWLAVWPRDENAVEPHPPTSYRESLTQHQNFKHFRKEWKQLTADFVAQTTPEKYSFGHSWPASDELGDTAKPALTATFSAHPHEILHNLDLHWRNDRIQDVQDILRKHKTTNILGDITMAAALRAHAEPRFHASTKNGALEIGVDNFYPLNIRGIDMFSSFEKPHYQLFSPLTPAPFLYDPIRDRFPSLKINSLDTWGITSREDFFAMARAIMYLVKTPE